MLKILGINALGKKIVSFQLTGQEKYSQGPTNPPLGLNHTQEKYCSYHWQSIKTYRNYYMLSKN